MVPRRVTKWGPTCHTDQVTDRHRDPKVPARLSTDDLEAGRTQLARHGRSVQDFVIASFRALRANPRPLLTLLDAHWPKPKRPGRPRKESASERVAEAGEHELVSEPFQDPA